MCPLNQKKYEWVGQSSGSCWFCILVGKGIVLHEFVFRGLMVNKQLYPEVSACFRDAVHRIRSELWKNQTWVLHHNNATAHASLLIRSYLAKIRHPLCPHPPYSQDLAPSDVFLFPKLKPTLKERRIQAI
jgi:hypothetical protein